MNRRKAFTLIELMIIIAVLGIALECFYGPGQTLLGIDARTRSIIDENYTAMQAFNRMKRFSTARSTIVKAAGHQLVFADGARLELDADQMRIILRENNEEIEIAGVKFFQPLKKLDARTFSLQMQINGEKLQTIWRCGK